MRAKAGNQLSNDVQTLDFGPGYSLTESLGDVVVSNGGLSSFAKLYRWYDKLATDPANAKICFLGDSTSFEPGVLNFYTRFRPKVGATSGAQTLPSATVTLVSTAGFPAAGTATVAGQAVAYTSVNATQLLGCTGGSGAIPDGSTVVAPASQAQVHTAPGGGCAGMTADASHIIAAGNNGLSLAGWIANSGGTYLLANLVTDQPDLIVFSFGLNDVRTHTDTYSYTTLRDLIITAVTSIRTACPNASIILRIPNSATTDDVSGLHSVTNNAGTVNPAGAAQALTDTLRKAYLAVADKWDNVVVWDAQTKIFGRKSIASTATNLFANQIHPSATGYQAIVDTLVADLIGLPLTYGPRLGDGTISTSTTPWTIDPASLDDSSHFQLVYAGEYNTQAAGSLLVGTSSNRVDDPTGYPDDVQPQDIVRLPDDTCFVITGTVAATASGAAVPNLTITQTIPANTATAGRVRVYRELDQGDLLLNKIRFAPGPNRYVRVGRIQAGTVSNLIIQAEPVTNGRVPSGLWSVDRLNDKLYVAGYPSNPVSFTTANMLLSGEHIFIQSSGVDWTNYVGRLVLIVGSHAPELVGNTLTTNVKSVSAAYTASANDHVLLGTAGSAFSVTLPTAVGRTGRQFTIKKVDASVNAVTVATTSAQTIDTATTYALSAQWKYVTVVSDGANWLIVANN